MESSSKERKRGSKKPSNQKKKSDDVLLFTEGKWERISADTFKDLFPPIPNIEVDGDGTSTPEPANEEFDVCLHIGGSWERFSEKYNLLIQVYKPRDSLNLELPGTFTCVELKDVIRKKLGWSAEKAFRLTFPRLNQLKMEQKVKGVSLCYHLLPIDIDDDEDVFEVLMPWMRCRRAANKPIDLYVD